MILKQFYLSCLAQASYLIGDEASRTAAVIDPRRDIDVYLEEAEQHGLEIRHVFLTHFHADFIAGHLELRNRTGAAIYLGARASAEYAFTPMSDGETLEFGRVRLRVLETPGHTPESISIVVYDLARDRSPPYAVLTGDTLFPAHGAGSLCGKGLSAETVSTIGEQRLSNYALQPMSPGEFVTSLDLAQQLLWDSSGEALLGQEDSVLDKLPMF